MNRRQRNRCLLAGVFFLVVAYASHAFYQAVELPVERVQVKGDLTHVTPDQAQAIIKPFLAQGLLHLDVQSLEESLKQQPWVKQVSIRRHWPDALRVTIQERKVIAQWGSDALLDQDLQLFKPKKETFPEVLILNTAGLTPEQALQHYHNFQTQLEPTGLDINKLLKTTTDSWEIGLKDGSLIRLGRGDIEERLQRFVHMYPKQFASTHEARRFDLRYPQAVAVRSLN